MPIYEYQCLKCEKVHEITQKFSDPLLETCPDCGERVQKRVSLGSFALKGSGWYTSDYKRAAAAPTGNETSSPPASPPAPAVSGESPASAPAKASTPAPSVPAGQATPSPSAST